MESAMGTILNADAAVGVSSGAPRAPRAGAGQRGADPAAAPLAAAVGNDAASGVEIDTAEDAVLAAEPDAASAVAGAAIAVVEAGAIAGAVAAIGVCDAAVPEVVIGSSGTISSATMLMILISGFTAGPAVSL